MFFYQCSTAKAFYIFCGIYSPEHPSSRARGRSMLSGDQKGFRDFTDEIGTSRCLFFIYFYLNCYIFAFSLLDL